MREFGLIGRTLRHSFSQAYFTQKFERLGLSDCRYELFELAAITELPALLAAHPQLMGLNVTIPYKEAVWLYVDEVSSNAARVGAINVIELRPDGHRVGHNTDVIGFRESLSRFYPATTPAGRALVLGTGGTSKAIRVALEERGIPYWVVSRDPLNSGLTWRDLTPALVAEHPLIINATPLGTFPLVHEYPPLPYEALTPDHYLFDVVYNPSETEFLRRGREAGAHTQNGFEMLQLQAEASWKIWNEE